MPGYKFLDFYSTEDLGALLLTAAVYKGPYYRELLDLLGCKAIDSTFILSLENPKGKPDQADTFWNARSFVKNYLNELINDVDQELRRLRTKIDGQLEEFCFVLEQNILATQVEAQQVAENSDDEIPSTPYQ